MITEGDVSLLWYSRTRGWRVPNTTCRMQIAKAVALSEPLEQPCSSILCKALYGFVSESDYSDKVELAKTGKCRPFVRFVLNVTMPQHDALCDYVQKPHHSVSTCMGNISEAFRQSIGINIPAPICFSPLASAAYLATVGVCKGKVKRIEYVGPNTRTARISSFVNGSTIPELSAILIPLILYPKLGSTAVLMAGAAIHTVPTRFRATTARVCWFALAALIATAFCKIPYDYYVSQ